MNTLACNRQAWKIVIPGNPIPLKRPRFSKSGTVYNSQIKSLEQNSFLIKAQYNGLKLSGPLKILIVFYMQIPRSYSQKKKKLFLNSFHDRKSDIDNLEKYAYDCIVMSDTILSDDSQISIVSSVKVWSDKPRTEFTIEQIDYKFDKNEFWKKRSSNDS